MAKEKKQIWHVQAGLAREEWFILARSESEAIEKVMDAEDASLVDAHRDEFCADERGDLFVVTARPKVECLL